MILARLSHAIRTQNWFAVALEFVIVIAGVAIGFQINALNEARIERLAERNALLAFSSELDAIGQEVVRARRLAGAKFDSAERLLDPEAGSLPIDTLDALLSDLLWHQRGTLDTGLIESLLTSSALALPRATDLRTDLARWPDRMSRFLTDQQRDARLYDEIYSPYLLAHAEIERIGASLRQLEGSLNTPEGYVAHLDTVQAPSIDHRVLLNDPEFRGILTTASWDQIDIIYEADRMEAAIEATRGRIAAHLGDMP